jgi:integrase
MINTYNFFDGNEKQTITGYINEYKFEKIITILLWEWLQTNVVQNILLERPFIMNKRPSYNVKVAVIKSFMEILGKLRFKEVDFTWEKYCIIMHQISVGRKAFRLPLRELTRSFYLHALTSETITNLQIKSIISGISKLLLTEEFKKMESKQHTPYINSCIRTNFPIGSNEKEIIQVKYFFKDDSIHYVNFYLPSRSQFLQNIMKKFLNILPKRKLNRVCNRMFVTFFEESTGSREVNRFEEFNEQTFKQQALYFKSLAASYDASEHKYYYELLVKFYRYIDDTYLEENGVRLFNSFSFNKDLIIHMYYRTSIEQGYEIVNLNSLGTCPKSDKWFVVVDANKHGAHVVNSKNSLMNFELVQNIEFRNVLKDYIWKLDMDYHHTYSEFSLLLDFLNEADNYFQQELQVLQLSDTLMNNLKPFSSRFLNFYYASIVSKREYASRYINNCIKSIKRFLKRIKLQFDIPDITIEQFVKIKIEDKGGTPIPFKDFKEIQREFETKFNGENELKLIILQLAVETKMRLGEILALKRDCISSIDDSGQFGTIEYYPKTSGRKKRKEVLLMEHIRLLQKALNLTKPLFEMAENSLREYIFLCSHSRYKNQVISAKNPFNESFAAISKDLFNQGKIKLKYTPSNLRDTYIDKAWQMVEDGLVSTLEVGVITGNSAAVAAKHYRNWENTKRYVEALYEVTILDDELPGSIVESGTIENLPPVQDGAGNCASELCIKVDIEEDSFYKCLTCKKFVTTVERYTFFEQRMKIYKSKGEISTSAAERDFYRGLMELYGSYLTEMYAIMEGSV